PGSILTGSTLIDAICDQRNRALLCGRKSRRVGIVGRHLAVEGDLVTSEIVVMSLSAAMAIAVSRVNALLNIVIHIGSFYHLSEVEGHPVQDDSGCRVRVEMFIARPRNRGGSGHQLRGYECNHHHHQHRYEQLDNSEPRSRTSETRLN